MTPSLTQTTSQDLYRFVPNIPPDAMASDNLFYEFMKAIDKQSLIRTGQPSSPMRPVPFVTAKNATLLLDIESEVDWVDNLPLMEPTEIRMAPLQFYNAGSLPFMPIDDDDWESIDE
jgi:hypothetical protein